MENLFGGIGEWWTVVVMSKCVVVWCVAEWTWLVVVTESVVGGPGIEPSFDYGD